MKSLQATVLMTATLAAGLMAGLFAAFSYAVMPGLASSSDHTFVEAMQDINEAIVNPLFMVLFLGPIPLLVLAGILAWRGYGRTALGWILAALACYVVAFFITSGANVPLNDQLADLENLNNSGDLAAARDDFEDSWVAWNIVRAVVHTAAFGCLAWALVTFGADRRAATIDR